jgi:hypothetical protein
VQHVPVYKALRLIVFMALDDMMGLLRIAPSLLPQLPLLTFLLFVSFVISFSWFLGFIAMRGVRDRWAFNYWIKLGIRLGLGFLCFIIGLSFSVYIPSIPSPSFFMIIGGYIGMFFGGFAASLILLVALRLVSYKIFNIKGMKNYIKHLEERLKRAQEIKVEEAKKSKARRVLNPVRIIGLIALAVILIHTALNFPGFPNPYVDTLAILGLEPQDIDNIAQQIGADMDMPPGCENIMILIYDNNDDMMNNRLPTSTDEYARSLVEAEDHTVIIMYDITHENDDYVLAMTTDSFMCHVKQGQLCGCLNVSSIMTMT